MIPTAGMWLSMATLFRKDRWMRRHCPPHQGRNRVWFKDWSTSPVRTGWDSWGCLTWRREDSVETWEWPFSSQRGGYKKEGDNRLFSRVRCDRTRGSGFKLKEGRFRLDIMMVRHGHRLRREVVDAFSFSTFKVRLDGALSTWLNCSCPCSLQESCTFKGAFQLEILWFWILYVQVYVLFFWSCAFCAVVTARTRKRILSQIRSNRLLFNCNLFWESISNISICF